jgi:hypothetical protein
MRNCGSGKKSLFLCDQDRYATADNEKHPGIFNPTESTFGDHANAGCWGRRSYPDPSLPRSKGSAQAYPARIGEDERNPERRTAGKQNIQYGENVAAAVLHLVHLAAFGIHTLPISIATDTGIAGNKLMTVSLPCVALISSESFLKRRLKRESCFFDLIKSLPTSGMVKS